MSTVDLNADDVAQTVRVGDTVLISGTVLEVSPGVGVLVELFSKTDQYRDWIREDRVVGLVVPDTPDEPADGSWIVGPDSDSICGGGINVYHRDDANAPTDPSGGTRGAGRSPARGSGSTGPPRTAGAPTPVDACTTTAMTWTRPWARSPPKSFGTWAAHTTTPAPSATSAAPCARSATR